MERSFVLESASGFLDQAMNRIVQRWQQQTPLAAQELPLSPERTPYPCRIHHKHWRRRSPRRAGAFISLMPL